MQSAICTNQICAKERKRLFNHKIIAKRLAKCHLYQPEMYSWQDKGNDFLITILEQRDMQSVICTNQKCTVGKIKETTF